MIPPTVRELVIGLLAGAAIGVLFLVVTIVDWKSIRPLKAFLPLWVLFISLGILAICVNATAEQLRYLLFICVFAIIGCTVALCFSLWKDGI